MRALLIIVCLLTALNTVRCQQMTPFIGQGEYESSASMCLLSIMLPTLRSMQAVA
jgi:hypothetical protein